MDSFRTTAFFLTFWHAFLTVMGTVILIVVNEVEPATAFLIAANLALLFSLVLIAQTWRLDERRVARGMFWRTVPPQERPRGEAGLRMARLALEETWLRFAKGAAAVAIVLSCLAFASHDSAPSAWASTPGAAQTLSGAGSNGSVLK